MLPWLTTAAVAYQPPNSTLSASAGTPWLVGGRGEAWYADELSIEVGAGIDDPGPVGIDAALRWRPDAICVACDRRAMLTFGVGVGAVLHPDFAFEDPLPWAVGPDAIATFVYWFSPAYGLAISGRGGAGPRFAGTSLDGVEPWGFGAIGIAF
ncbi:MAG: hypothetical protein ABMA64_33905 [Myxococcota bacterium]